MAEANLDVALRIKTDVDEARRSLPEVNANLDNIGRSADRANTALTRSSARFDALVDGVNRVVAQLQTMNAQFGAVATASTQAAQAAHVTDQIDASAKNAASSVRALGESEAEATTRIRAMLEASRAQAAAQYEAGAASAAQTTTAREAAISAEALAAGNTRAADALAAYRAKLDVNRATQQRSSAATAEQRTELARLLGQIDPTVAGLDRLDRMQEKLRAARAAGLLGNDDFARFTAVIERQRAGITGASEAMHSFSLNSSNARRELGRLATDMAAGNWGRFQQTGLTLANYSGLTRAVFSPVGVAVGAIAATLGAYAVAAVRAYQETQTFNRALLATGDAVGMSTSSMQQLAANLGRLSGSSENARTAVLGLAKTGQFTGDALQTAAESAVNMARLTGQSMDQAVTAIVRLQNEPVRAAAELDKQLHFLNTTTFQRIQALQAQGDSEQAAALAQQALSAALASRVQQDIANMAPLEKAWHNLNAEVRQGLNLLMQAGSRSVQHQLDSYYAKRGSIQDGPEKLTGMFGTHDVAYFVDGKGFASKQAALAYIDQKTADLKDLQSAQDAVYANTAKDAQVNTAGNTASLALEGMAKGYDKVADRAAAAARVTKMLSDVVSANGNLPADVFQMGDKFFGKGFDYLVNKEAGISNAAKKARDTTSALAADMKSLQDQVLSLSSSALGPVSAIWDRYTKAMLAASAAGAKAIKDGGNVGDVQAMVSKVQTAAAQARDNALAQQHTQLQRALAQATGDQATAARLGIEQQYGAMLTDMQRMGDTAGVALVQKLMDVSQARAQFQQLQQAWQTTLADMQRQEQSINAQQQAGLISQIDARGQIVQLHKQAADALAASLPQAQALAAALKDPAVAQSVANMAGQIEQLRLTASLAQATLQQGLEQGFGAVLDGLAARTMSLRDAVLTVISDISRAFAQIAIQALAQKAAGAIMGAFGGGKDVGQGAAKLTVASGALAGASTLLGANADRLLTAAAALAAANATGFAAGFATGGYTGTGGTLDVAGVVHAGEYVQPASRVAEPGALAFMRDFHARGMTAIAAWAPGYASGGFVSPLANVPSPSVPAMPRMSLPEAPDGARPAAAINQRIINVVDPELVSAHLRTPAGRDDVLNIIQANRSSVRQMVR